MTPTREEARKSIEAMNIAWELEDLLCEMEDRYYEMSISPFDNGYRKINKQIESVAWMVIAAKEHAKNLLNEPWERKP